MECDSEFRRLANRNKFIDDLEKQGYAVDFVGNHLVIYGLPYLDHKGALCYGDVATPFSRIVPAREPPAPGPL